MKILLYEWSGIMQRDVKAVLRRNGHEVIPFSYESPDWKYDEYMFTNMKQYVERYQVDMILSMLFFPTIADLCHEKGLPYLAWVYDSPFVIHRREALRYEEVYAFVFDRKRVEELRAEGLRVFYRPLAVDTVRLDGMEITGDDCRKWSADASFVGQLYQKEGGEIKNSLERAQYETSLQRIKCVKALNEICNFKLYSGKKCSIPELKDLQMCGSVMYYSEMPKVFRLSKVNLNVTLQTIESGIPLRALDIMGAGGFLMTNPQEELLEYFQVGRDLETYESAEELCEKTVWYLNNEDMRAEIARQGHDKVKVLFSYEKQFAEMFAQMGLAF